MNLDPSYLLHLGMDGPSVNKSFEDKLLTELREQDIQILNIGSCCQHKVHNAFCNALKQINCDLISLQSTYAPFSNYLAQGETIIYLWKRTVYV